MGFGLYYWGLKRVSAVLATSLEMVGPIFGALGAYFWLHEDFSRLQWVTGGMLLGVIFGIAQFEHYRRSCNISGRFCNTAEGLSNIAGWLCNTAKGLGNIAGWFCKQC